jgi:hypothetical protein
MTKKQFINFFTIRTFSVQFYNNCLKAHAFLNEKICRLSLHSIMTILFYCMFERNNQNIIPYKYQLLIDIYVQTIVIF